MLKLELRYVPLPRSNDVIDINTFANIINAILQNLIWTIRITTRNYDVLATRYPDGGYKFDAVIMDDGGNVIDAIVVVRDENGVYVDYDKPYINTIRAMLFIELASLAVAEAAQEFAMYLCRNR